MKARLTIIFLSLLIPVSFVFSQVLSQKDLFVEGLFQELGSSAAEDPLMPEDELENEEGKVDNRILRNGIAMIVDGYNAKEIHEFKHVIFNGDNYSQAWHDEAQKRGLPMLRGTADALPTLRQAHVAEMFAKYGVMSERELNARIDVLMETYATTLAIEAATMLQMADRMVRPAGMRYATELAESCAATSAVGVPCAAIKSDLERITGAIDRLAAGEQALREAVDHEDGDNGSHAAYIQNTMIPIMEDVRAACDEIESIVPADLWPMPTYTDMLFNA